MPAPHLLLPVLFCAALLGGCVETDDVVFESEPVPIVSDPNSAAVVACRQAIANAAGISVADVSVYDAPGSEAGTRVMATIATSTAPWSCIADNNGNVAQVMSTADEGAL